MIHDRVFLSPILTPKGGDATDQIWFKGGLYNQPELIAALSLPPNSMPEVTISAACVHWGIDAPRRLRGAFAFAAALPETGCVIAARDPSGQEPLFYTATQEGIHLAQTIAALAQAEDRAETDDARVTGWIESPKVNRTRTFLKNVCKLPPGHVLEWRAGVVTISRYWRPENLAPFHSVTANDLWKEYAMVLKQAVGRRLAGEQLGSHASGGIDSTAIYFWARELSRTTGRQLTAFSWHAVPGPEDTADEHQRLLTLSRHCDGGLQHCPPNAATIIEVLSQDVTRRPWMQANVMLTERAVQHAADQAGIRTLLSGWGGDDIASQNYGSTHRLACLHAWRLTDYWQSLPTPRSPRQLWRDMRTLVKRRSKQTSSRSTDASFLHPDWQPRGLLPSIEVEDIEARLFPASLQAWNDGHLAERIEAYFDSGADLGIHYAHPLLDQAVMEFALRIPYPMAVSAGHNRWPFRNAIASVVPAEIAWARAKRESARVEASREIMRAALTEIGHLIRTRSTQPKRAGFFDMPQLMRALEPDALANCRHFGPICRTLSFLDF